jgi:hypothetical protein
MVVWFLVVQGGNVYGANRAMQVQSVLLKISTAMR